MKYLYNNMLEQYFGRLYTHAYFPWNLEGDRSKRPLIEVIDSALPVSSSSAKETRKPVAVSKLIMTVQVALISLIRKTLYNTDYLVASESMLLWNTKFIRVFSDQGKGVFMTSP